MAPTVGEAKFTTEKPLFGTTTPNKFDFSKIELGSFLGQPNAPENESFLRKYLNYVKAHNAPINEKLKQGKAELKEIKHEVYALKRAYKNADSQEEQTVLEGQLKAAKGLEWAQIRKNIRLAFSLA
ncbi:hypothetical protein IJD34_06745 [bacterium]|nr:hypothetical protein [bacterium]